MVKNIEESTTILLQKIKEKIGSPVSVDVVVATLESLGIKSENVQEDFGYKNSWELATYIFQELTVNVKSLIKNNKQLDQESSIDEKPKKIALNAYLFFKQYFLSTSYLLAFAIQLTSIIAYGFSIYIYTGFNHVQSTVVVLGIVIGMIISGGFIQVIGNQVSKHFYLKDFRLVEEMTFYLLKKGTLFIVSCIALLFLVNLALPFYPVKTALLISSYAFWVAMLFLVFAPLHVIRNRKIILLATIVATLTCLPLTDNTFFNIYQLHFLGLFVAIATVIIFLIIYFKLKKGHHSSSKIKIHKGAIFYNNLHPFIYGILINIFFFIDRIIAWSGTEVGIFFMPIYYEKDYEIGMDISIVFFLLLAGILEYGNISLFNLLNTYKNKTTLVNLKSYKRKVRNLYIKNLLLIFIASLPIYFIILYILYGSWGYNHFFIEPLKGINIKVANIGVIGYLFLCCGMLNSSYLLSMKKQKEVLLILSFSCIINITSGLILSRLFSYEDSVYGMLIASVAFTFLSFKENIKVYKNIDYYATL
ncbi:MATE family efflux transporter [Tenacibaculum xiamenense]|uniref:hypothetical protein n=1 Tax=Tenacibaculum xiamenense TaxID=1261553 RepID=UPI0038958E5A